MSEGWRVSLFWGFLLAAVWYVISQCRKPAGWLGRRLVRGMNRSHADVTAWGLGQVEIRPDQTLLDVGCGGGRTIERLAHVAEGVPVYGVDYSAASVAASCELNRAAIESGRVQIQLAAVSRLPFPDGWFDLVTAVETHYYWPDRSGDLREVSRVLKPGGRVVVIGEAYRGRTVDWVYGISMRLLGGAYLSPADHRNWLEDAGFGDVKVIVEPSKGWICATGRKPWRG